jgi:hypothetical protein
MRIVHTGPDTYQAFVDLGLDVQPVHAGLSRFSHLVGSPWDLYWRPAGENTWREVKVGDIVETP